MSGRRALLPLLVVLTGSLVGVQGFGGRDHVVVRSFSSRRSSTFSFSAVSVDETEGPRVVVPSSFESTLTRDTAASLSPTTTTNAVLPARHVRWYSSSADTTTTTSDNDSNTSWALQTAVTSWKHATTGQRVELHAMVHFGDASYYQAYNHDQTDFSQNRRVLYELLLDDGMLEAEDDDHDKCNFRRVSAPLSASPVDRQTAARYGWACQVDVLDYQQPGWRHADWTRGEFQQALQQASSSSPKHRRNDGQGQPLWQQASSSSPSAATEAATALFVGPPTMSTKDSWRRLFSNLFLPGSALTQFLRLTLWLTVPAPELSILLLDWSATTSSRNLWQASWNPIVRFLLQALWEARLDFSQRLAFGQVLLTGSRPTSPALNAEKDGDIAQTLLIQGRNQRALDVLDQTLKEDDDPKKTIALLYGSSHCPDLSQSLRQRGFVPQSTAWRTAWSVTLGSPRNDNSKKAAAAAVSGTTLPLWLVPASLYLTASAADWLASWQAVGSADTTADMAILAGAYGVRHVLLYLGLSKVVLDWQKPGAD